MRVRDGRYPIRDHDYFETVEGWVFCVVSDIHPPGRVLALLKYVPGDGPWCRDGVKFMRMVRSYSMHEVGRTISYVRERRSEYVYRDPTTLEEFTYPPLKSVVRHFKPEERLREIMESPRWMREEDCRRLAHVLSDGRRPTLRLMGVSGSILPGLQYENADVDIIVYGGQNYLKILEVSDQIQGPRDRERLEAVWLNSFLSRYRLMKGEAVQLFQRVRNKGYYMNVPYSIHAVRTVEDIGERYGDKLYRPAGVGRAILRVVDSSESHFTPSFYRVEGKAGEVDVETLTCYDSTYAGLFHEGDVVEAVGKLETVYDRISGRRYANLLVGSLATAGIEYVKLLGGS